LGADCAFGAKNVVQRRISHRDTRRLLYSGGLAAVSLTLGQSVLARHDAALRRQRACRPGNSGTAVFPVDLLWVRIAPSVRKTSPSDASRTGTSLRLRHRLDW
jgi:hypothetical protein